MAKRGTGYGWFLVIGAFILALAVFWFVEPTAMPGPLREHVCVAP